MAISSSQSIRPESAMVPELHPIMPVDLFRAVMKGDGDVLIRRLGLQPEEQTDVQYIGDDISEYVKTEGNKFSLRWFEDVMVPQIDSKDRWERTQVIGLGSVLITTVAFAAAFAISGGYNGDHGTPVLGRRYMFRIFILANTLAFIQGSISLLSLLLTVMNNKYNRALPFATISFMLALCSMILSFGLGLYLMLAPVCYPIAVLVLVITLFLGSPVGIAIIAIAQDNLMARPSSDAFFYQIMASIVVSFMIIFFLAFL